MISALYVLVKEHHDRTKHAPTAGNVVEFSRVFVPGREPGDDAQTKRKESKLNMKDKNEKADKRDKKGAKTSKKGMKTPTTPVPTTATELSEEDLKKVTGGVSPRDVASGYLK